MIRIYIQELSTYNNAVPVGKWINVEDFESEIHSILEEATIVLKENGYHYGVDAEEFEIVDWECDEGINLDSIAQSIEKLQALNELLQELSQEEIEKLKFLFNYHGYDLQNIDSDTLQNVYTYNEWDEAVEEFIELYLEVPEESKVYNYIDYQAIQRDLEIDGYIEYDNKIYTDFN
ncbi:antirestriction protein ArdA [Sulfurimonas sp.]|uniref:antirestriction protein ArdA n=1 Tax=Sulfurimonas sp. TaxID=2022749 RepID=UPI003D12660D